MSVLVIGRNGRALMPTTSRKARLLLKKKTASVVCRHPFTIQLLYKTFPISNKSSHAAWTQIP